MAKYKDGDYIHLYWADEKEYEVFRGWCDIEHCRNELDNYWGVDSPLIARIEHAYGFFGVGTDETGEPWQSFYERDKPGRGRFKVTLCYLEE